MFDIVEFVKQQERFFCEALTEPTLTWAKESQFAIQQFQKNDFLAKTAQANLPSARNAIINVAAIGITLNPSSKLAYLVPRGGAVCLDISYMGLLHLAQVTGAIQWGQCKLVYEKDIYESNGIDCAPTHKYNPFVDRGARIGGYCVVKTSEGDYLTEEMSNREIEVIRACSKAGGKGG
ncbi:recombinase RecT, partial [Escherichia coli]|nr:recombinase RecT [Escherichia coli]EFG1415760.1 recombinase RecT [Escherichia coli]